MGDHARADGSCRTVPIQPAFGRSRGRHRTPTARHLGSGRCRSTAFIASTGAGERQLRMADPSERSSLSRHFLF